MTMIHLGNIPLKDAPFPWFVVGGWALDLFLGKETRRHQDIDVGIFRRDQLALQEFLADWTLTKFDQGKLTDWHRTELLTLPIHEIHAKNPSGFEFEILFSERDDARWIYRRDPSISAPLSDALIEISPGLRVLSPEIVLLFKSKNIRDRDQQDFNNIIPRIPSRRSQWLLNALRAVYDSHEWISKLSR